MFQAEIAEDGEVKLIGRLDAAQAEKAQAFLDQLEGPSRVDLSGLDYISSAGLGVLLKTQKRLMPAGGGLTLTHVNSHINDIFKYSGFDQIFQIEPDEA
jgi:anti-anti-sigma factor